MIVEIVQDTLSYSVEVFHVDNYELVLGDLRTSDDVDETADADDISEQQWNSTTSGSY
jgi:hypothetical protein